MYYYKTLLAALFAVPIFFSFQNCAKNLDQTKITELNSFLSDLETEKNILNNGPTFINFQSTIGISLGHDTLLNFNPILEHEDQFTFEWRKAEEDIDLIDSTIISNDLKLFLSNGGNALDSSFLGTYSLFIYFKDQTTPITKKTLTIFKKIADPDETENTPLVMCSNFFGEKGLKDTIAMGASSIKPVIYYKYQSSNTISFQTKNCGIRNVNDSDFYTCMGNWSYCGNSANAENWKAITTTSGMTCIKTSYGNDLEWCGKGGIDGSWAIYSCTFKTNQYVYNLNCDTL